MSKTWCWVIYANVSEIIKISVGCTCRLQSAVRLYCWNFVGNAVWTWCSFSRFLFYHSVRDQTCSQLLMKTWSGKYWPHALKMPKKESFSSKESVESGLVGKGVVVRIRRFPVQTLLGARSGLGTHPRYEGLGDQIFGRWLYAYPICV